jgi:hypothetical protein
MPIPDIILTDQPETRSETRSGTVPTSTARPGVTSQLDRSSLRSSSTTGDPLDRHPAFGPVLRWLQETIAQPDLRLGRPGDVCPRVAPALRDDLIWLITGSPGRAGSRDAAALSRPLIDLFEELFPTDRERRAGALVAVFPDLPETAAAAFIDAGHGLMRSQFVSNGLMVGQFHPGCPVGSVHNPDLLVTRSPVPLFAVRALSPHDLIFLDRPEIPAPDRLAYLGHFLAHLGGQLNPTTYADVLARLHTARTAARAPDTARVGPHPVPPATERDPGPAAPHTLGGQW